MLRWIANSLVLRADTEADTLFMPVGHKDSGGDFGFNSKAFMRALGSSKETPRSVRFKDRAQRPGIVPSPSSAVHHGEPHDAEQVHSFVTHDPHHMPCSALKSPSSLMPRSALKSPSSSMPHREEGAGHRIPSAVASDVHQEPSSVVPPPTFDTFRRRTHIHRAKPRRKKRLLVLDGGGVRGLYTAATLAHLVMKTGKPLHELFDAVVGTSTGGLMALLVAFRGTTIKTLVDTFTKGATEIFHKKHKRFKNRCMMGPKYSPKGLTNLILDTCTGFDGDTMLGDREPFAMPVGVTAVNVETNTAELINSVETKYAGVPVMLAARATTAAPTFFPQVDVTLANGKTTRYVDGGVGGPHLDLGRAPYGMCGVKHIDLASLGLFSGQQQLVGNRGVLFH